MGIKKEDIEYIANLARIELDEELLNLLSRDLSRVLDYVDQLKELDVEGIPPTTYVVDLNNVLRKDWVLPSIEKEKVLKPAPQRRKDYFKVPKIIE